MQCHSHCICPNSKCATDALILRTGKSVYASVHLLTDPNKIVLFPNDILYWNTFCSIFVPDSFLNFTP